MINNERGIYAQQRCSYCGGSKPTKKQLKQQRKENGYKKQPFNIHNSNIKCNEHNGRKPNTCFICVLEDHLIASCPETDFSDEKVHWST